MVGAIASSGKKAVPGGKNLDGHVILENGKFVDNQERIGQHLDEAARYLCQVLNYSLTDVYQMNCYQFHRELLFAEQFQEKERKSIEKWQKK